MLVLLCLGLFAVTLAGGGAPLWLRVPAEGRLQLLLAFSGSALLGITLLHVLPESFAEVGEAAGMWVLAGFFIQLVIQRITHGVEHGHVHIHTDAPGHAVPIWSILGGLGFHAFMEGLPLGFYFREAATQPSLFLAVAAHKVPEAMLATTLALGVLGKRRAWGVLAVFAAITPVAGLVAHWLGVHYGAMARLVTVLVPVVAGAFLHIATTIFYESGTRHHHLTRQKTAAIGAGLALALATLLFE